MGTSETLRSVLDAGRGSKRLDELGIARVIQLVAAQIHAAEQRAGNAAIGPVTPSTIELATSGAVALRPAAPGASGYRAPELLGGGGDRRSDVFSLGVVMWEALTGQRLFAAADEATRQVPLPSELNANIPAELAAICMKALAKNPADRYQSVKVMGVELEEFLREAGYPDDNEQIATYLAKLANAATVPMAPAVPAPAAPPAPAPTPAPAVPSVLATPPTPAAPAPSVLASAPTPVAPAPSVLAAPPPEPAPAPARSPAPAGTQPPPLAADKPAEPHPLTGGLTLPGVPPLEPRSPAPVATEPASERSAPHPAAAVALGPAPRSRAESQGEVLANWAWQTDSQTAIDDDDDVHASGTSNRKLLVYLIGGGVALASIVAIIMVGFGSDHAKKPASATKPAVAAQVAAATPAPAAAAPTPPPPTAGSAVAPDPGSAAAAPAAGSDEAIASDGSAATEAAATPPPAETTATAPPPPETHAPPPPETHTPPPPETHTSTRPTVAHASHAEHERKHVKADRTGAEVAYHEALMKFTRGDTGAALTALHSALAADSGYAPTWRMLGLVYEKTGEKSAARAAFRHYLQLDPGAPDAAQIRLRMEKLGS